MDVKNVEALLKKLSLSLDQWRLSVLKGKVLIGDIICQLYPEEKTREPNPPDSVQTLTLELANLVADMGDALLSLERVRDKFSALLELNSLSNQTGAQTRLEINKNLVYWDDLQSWSNSIYQDYKEQVNIYNTYSHILTIKTFKYN